MKNKLIQISAWIAAHITLVVVLVTAVALFLPSSFNWIDTSAITPMLGVVMFGMGLTLRPSDFRPVLQHPKDILVGELAQFLIMPSLAWLLCKLLSLPEELALGVILVGCCPGGTASNVICYLAKGDVALSVAMTGVSTLLAPIVTPALVWLLAGESVEVDVAGMFLSIVQVVIVPIVLGLLAHFTQIYHLYNLLIYNILRRNLQLFITEFCIFSPCIIFISNKNSDKSIEILHISPKYITSVDNLMIHIFSSTFNFLYSFTPSDRLESKS